MSKYKPLPQLPKEGDGSPEGELLRAIKQVHASKDRLILPVDYKRPNVKMLPEIVAKQKFNAKGEKDTFFRIKGKSGDDVKYLPFYVEMIRAEQKLMTEINKAIRISRIFSNGDEARKKGLDKRKKVRN